jgi:hypothetical protein
MAPAVCHAIFRQAVVFVADEDRQPISTVAFSSQDRMPMSRNMVAAVAR